MNSKTISYYVILAAAMILSSCGDKPQPQTQAPQVLDYPVITLSKQSTRIIARYPANIEGEQNIEIRPKIDGYIEQIYVDEGATVTAGQKLFKIFAPQYEQDVRTAEANIEIAKANVSSAEMEVKRIKPLVEKGIISEYELQTAEYNLASRKATLAQAQATLANAKTNLSYTVVTSPVNGVIGNIPYRIGSLVSSNTQQPLTTVSNIRNIYAYFSINERQFLEFSANVPGKTLVEKLKHLPSVQLELSNGTLYSESGKIETASGIIHTGTGSVRMRATFPNPKGTILSGSTGVVLIPSNLDSVILIPQKSTYEIQGQKFAFVVNADGTISGVPLKVSDTGDGKFYIVTEGLSEGDKIVLEGVATLRDGSAIKPVEVNTDSVYHRLRTVNLTVK